MVLQSDLIGTVDDLNLYAYVYNDPANRTDPSGNCGNLTEAKTGDCPIQGKAQSTGSADHAPAGNADAQRMAASGKYESVHLNQKLSTITGNPAAGGQQPDVAGVQKGTGAVDTIEHPSTSQSPKSQDVKGGSMQERLSSLGRGGTHETRSTSQAVGEAGKPLSGSPSKVLGIAGAVIGLPGAIAAQAKNPEMSTAEFVYRATGTYDLAVAAGYLPPPPIQY